MKKAFALFFALIVISGFSARAAVVDVRDARVVGKNFYFERINQYQDVAYNSIVITSEMTDSENGQPMWYVFNFNGDKGFVIVSADDASWPVIGYSFKGTFSTENMPANLEYWMGHYRDQIRASYADKTPAEESTVNEWTRLMVSSPSQLQNLRGTLDLLPLLNDNEWNQTFPWNAMCPSDPAGANGHVVVGCVATSMTQLMYYWRFPETGQGQHCIYPTPSYGAQCADFGATTYEWNGMDNHGKNGSSFRQSDPMALLCWHGGISVDMNYSPEASGAFSSSVPVALKNYFKYASSTEFIEKIYYYNNTWKAALRGSLDAKCPIQYSGSGSGGGHAWICDGYQGTDYFHMNWGWGGSDNGYFLLTNLNPGGYLFNQNQTATINAEPGSNYPPNCSGQVIVDAYDFGSIEDGSGPKASYLPNLNCSWLIAPDDSVQNIILNFERFDVAAGDSVRIYDGATTSANLLASFSGNSIPSEVSSTGPQMLVTFVTDGVADTSNGWQADFETNLVSFCSGSTTLTEATGDINDGSGRFQYRNSSSCKWYIKPENAETATLTFDSFNTEQDADALSIYDLGSAELLATLSGEYTTPPGPFTSPSGQILMIFNSNNHIRGEGWSCSYSITVSTPDIKGVEAMKVYPNPAKDMLNITFNAVEMQSIRLDLVSAIGQTVYSEDLGKFQGSYNKQLNVSNLAKGIYMLKMSGEKGVKITKVVVQ